MPYTFHQGVRLYYETQRNPRLSPDATPVVLVRGLARSIRFWMDFRTLMAESFHLVLLDNRGVGFSDAPRPPYSTDAMADDVAAVLDAAGVAKAHVLGISLGGMIAMKVAIRHSERVERLILGCTTGGGSRAKRVPARVIAGMLRGATQSFSDTLRSTAPFVLSEGFRAGHPEILDRWADIGAKEPPQRQGLVGQLLAGALHNASQDLGLIRVRTLLLTGDADALIPWENSLELARRIPDSRLQILPGAGRDFPTELPELTARAVREFLEAPNTP